jgi:signal transduction histidine kinase
MVRRLVELRGGEVWIADAPAGGACVGFTWPE